MWPSVPELPPMPLLPDDKERLEAMSIAELRTEAARYDRLAEVAQREGDEWDRRDCRDMALHCRRIARRKEIA